ncbi:TetR/AcrR family transcriptional regulator [Nocardia sp. NPDC058519]|uniref:TetR/AcrR family transcriptional regulator n=1 Tax=Nocardia sp. NPDC058519 TaxID=3346535 RepID=UPI003651B3D5
MTSAHNSSTGRRYSGLAAEERTRARRDALLEAALDRFGTAGFAATSVKQICGAASLTERYFYESFRDRQASLVQVYAMLVAEMRQATETAIAAAGSETAVVVRAGLAAFIEYLTEDPRRARIVLIEVVGVSPELEELRHGVLRAFGELIGSVWSTEAGIDPDDERTRLSAIALSGAVNNLLVDWMMTGQRQSVEVLVEVCTTLFLAAAGALRRAE